MKMLEFRFVGGPHDGDKASFPVATVPTSKSLVLQDRKSPLGVLAKYFFNRLTGEAVYQGTVEVSPDKVAS